MDSKTFLFGFGTGMIIASAFLFVAFVAGNGTGKVEASRMSNREVADLADEMILEAGSRGIEKYAAMSETRRAEMSDEEIIAAAGELGMAFPQVATAAAAETPSPEPPLETPAPADTPTPQPTSTPAPTEAPTPTDTPAPTPTDTPEPTPESPKPATEDGGDYVHVVIPRGTHSSAICEILFDAGLLQDIGAFNRYIIENGKEERLIPGEYDIPKDSTAAEILAIIAS